jgi:hypothetical protein
VEQGSSTTIEVDQAGDPELKQLEKIRSRLTELRVQKLEASPDALALLADCPDLKLLHVGGELTDAHTAQIGKVVQLRTLSLAPSRITDAGLASLATLESLRLLRLSSPHVTDKGMKTIVELPSLKWLHLIEVPVSDEGIDLLSQKSSLESFYLDGGRASDESLYRMLKAIPGLHFHRDQTHLEGDAHKHPHD